MSQSLDVNDLFGVKDKVVLVTGGATGIGRMIADGFVRNGAKVYIASRTLKSLEATAAELNAVGPGTCIPLALDLLAPVEHIEKFVKELAQKEQALNVLVNNAGAILPETNFEGYPDRAWAEILTVDLQRVFTLTQKLLPLLTAGAAQGTGRIINIGSTTGENISPFGFWAYGVAKAGLHQLSRVLAGHLAERRITSNTLACGPFLSQMTGPLFEGQLDHIGAAIPLGRVGAPHDVAAASLWLAGKGGEWITGATIPLAGGILVAKANM